MVSPTLPSDCAVRGIRMVARALTFFALLLQSGLTSRCTGRRKSRAAADLVH